jgi:hypothetical protein
VHDSGLVAASVVEYFPTSQFKHVSVVVAASVVEYFPRSQFKHVEPASEYLPAGQF